MFLCQIIQISLVQFRYKHQTRLNYFFFKFVFKNSNADSLLIIIFCLTNETAFPHKVTK